MEKHTRHFLDFHIAGFAYWDGIELIQQLKVGDSLDLVYEDENPFDPHAVALYREGKKIGYVPQANNAQLFQLLYFGHDIFEATISQIDLEAHPERQLRAVVRLKDARTIDRPL
ncbi:MAG: HIRAN domain-containing protein [Eggerthellaceae bacterium]|nr:HIRAN domain-containing protein [Eggerthellaceae bacterium]